jgi:hypothetical protein
MESIRYVADGESYDFGDSALLLIDATLKADMLPVALPKREFMENAKKIWEELGPQLSPRAPWRGYSLGHWPKEASVQADNAAAGDFVMNEQYGSAKGIKVPRGASFMKMKTAYLSKEFENSKTEKK